MQTQTTRAVQTVTIKMTDAELHTALDVLAAWRDAALSERGAADLPPVLVNNGQAEPEGADARQNEVLRRDGDILRVGSLLAKLQGEAMKRDLSGQNGNAHVVHDDYDADAEPVDMAFIAELRAADEETKRVGYIPFEDVVRRAEADDGPGFLSRLRARQAAYKAGQSQAEAAG